jgi:hypothetical protein
MVLLNGILRELDIGAYKMVEQILSICAILQPIGDPFAAEILNSSNGAVLPRDRNQRR